MGFGLEVGYSFYLSWKLKISTNFDENTFGWHQTSLLRETKDPAKGKIQRVYIRSKWPVVGFADKRNERNEEERSNLGKHAHHKIEVLFWSYESRAIHFIDSVLHRPEDGGGGEWNLFFLIFNIFHFQPSFHFTLIF